MVLPHQFSPCLRESADMMIDLIDLLKNGFNITKITLYLFGKNVLLSKYYCLCYYYIQYMISTVKEISM